MKQVQSTIFDKKKLYRETTYYTSTLDCSSKPANVVEG